MESGFLIIDKPVGMTSRMVDNAIGRLFHTRHIGHLGTLDPFASGMLLVAVNKANKCLPFIEDGEKNYIAKLELFKSTSTGDTEGEVTKVETPWPITPEKVKQVLDSFVGKSFQIPPMTSAIKMEGEALYKKARRGEEVERKPREIEIGYINLLDFDGTSLVFDCRVSKGTYIRVLGEDIAKKLGTIGYLSSLRRTQIGDLNEEAMVNLDEATKESLIPSSRLFKMKKLIANEERERKIKNGMPLFLPEIDDDEVLFLFENEEPMAVYYRAEKSQFRCKRGLF